jgi:transcriptional regulator with XRE-family HTH domain
MASEEEWDPSLRELGEFIRAQRQMADLSLRRLAELTNVSNAYLSQIERGLHQPSIRVLRSIADALNLSADTLLAQAGLRSAATEAVVRSAAAGSALTTEAAILADPALTDDQRDVLLRVYRSFTEEGRGA